MRERSSHPVAIGRGLARRGAGMLPEPLIERARLAEARLLETRLRRSPAVRGAALVLHAVAPSGGDPRFEIDPPLAAERLDAIVAYLTDRYRLVRAAELPDAAGARRPRERVPIAVTFDDDLACHLEHAAPVVARHGAVASVFLCARTEPFWWHLLQAAIETREIDADALAPLPSTLVAPALQRQPGAIAMLASAVESMAPAQRDELTARLQDAVAAPAPLLSRQGAAELAAGGWEIGFHTRRHDPLTALDDAALREALRPARELAGNERARTLAYPHGAADERVARAARQAGYVAAYTTSGKVLTQDTDPYLIGRLYPETASVGRFALGLARHLARPA